MEITTVEDLEQRIYRFLHEQLPGAEDLAIEGLHRVGAGLSRENWPFDLHWREGGNNHSLPLILRRDPTGSVLETDRTQEFRVLSALATSGIPAPKVYWLDAHGTALGRPGLIMQRYGGICDYYVLEGGIHQHSLEDRVQLARHFCELVAQIHTVDWEKLGLGDVLPNPGLAGADAAIAEWEAYLARQALEPLPELDVVLAWLRRHAPVAQRVSLVHGDFKPGNLLLTQGGKDVEVILDWETAHLGDPIEDIGWVTNPMRAREHIIPGAWEKKDLFAYYEELTGLEVRPADVYFWNVFANFKLAAIVLTGVRSVAEARADRIYTYATAQGLMLRLLNMIEAAP